MKLVVVGDALLDVDVEGTVSRVCPDAPAPVLEIPGPVVRHWRRPWPRATAWT